VSESSETTFSTPLTSTTKTKAFFAEKACGLQTTADCQKKSNLGTLVEARKKENIVPIIGNGTDSILKDVAHTPKAKKDFWEVSVSHLEETTIADQVKSHLHQHGIKVRDVWVFASKIKGTKSSRVRITLEQRERIKDPKVWPLGCIIQDWIKKPKSEVPKDVRTGSEGNAK
jgi:hypothetical protein